jgi:hypothetical protein
MERQEKSPTSSDDGSAHQALEPEPKPGTFKI